MTRTYLLLNRNVLPILTSAALMLAVPSIAFAQHSRGGGSSSGHSSSGGGDGSSSGGSSGGGHSAPSGTSSDGAHAVPRGTSGSSGTSRSGNGPTGSVTRDGSRDSSGTANSDSSGTRSRDGRTTIGHAVARPPNTNGGGTVLIVPGYYPWAYGGIGFGGYYGFYDPGWYDPYPPVYTSSGDYGYEGALRLKVKPREASVYVDGYFTGRVDDFDGVFQRLKIDAGPHRVEIRLDGYEPLTFDVRIDPDRTTTYSGELKKLP
jgi:hypothetical protein